MIFMSKILFKGKDVWSLLGLSIIFGIVKTCIMLPKEMELNIENAFLLARDGNMDFGNGEYNAEVLLTTFTLLMLYPIISRIFSDDYHIAKSYILFRLKSNAKWYYFKVFQSFIYCLFVSFWNNLAILLTAAAMGYKADSTADIIIYFLFGIFANCIILFLFVYLNNICGLALKPHIAAVISFSVFIVNVGLTCFASSKSGQYHLLINYYISWHLRGDVSMVKSLPSFVYYLIISYIILIAFFIGKRLIKKTGLF